MLTVRPSHLAIAVVTLISANVVAFNLHETPHQVSTQQSVTRDEITEARLKRIEATLRTLLTERSTAALSSDHIVHEQKVTAMQSPSDSLTVSDELNRNASEETIDTENHQLTDRASFLDASFMAEPMDPSWSMAAAESVNRDLPAIALQNSQVSDIACQSHLCRIQATHADITAEQTFLIELGNLSAFRNGETFMVTTPRQDGSLATTIYVSRSDQHLPAVGG
jgi:hypothetical protein